MFGSYIRLRFRFSLNGVVDTALHTTGTGRGTKAYSRSGTTEISCGGKRSSRADTLSNHIQWVARKRTTGSGDLVPDTRAFSTLHFFCSHLGIVPRTGRPQAIKEVDAPFDVSGDYVPCTSGIRQRAHDIATTQLHPKRDVEEPGKRTPDDGNLLNQVLTLHRARSASGCADSGVRVSPTQRRYKFIWVRIFRTANAVDIPIGGTNSINWH